MAVNAAKNFSAFESYGELLETSSAAAAFPILHLKRTWNLA